MNFTLAELTKIKLQPGEVLSVKLYGDDYDDVDIQGLQNQLQATFPNNKVMMFVLPVGKDLQMEAISGSLENTDTKELAEVKAKHEDEKAKLIEQLQAMNSCGPVGYCTDCSCGKKAMAEAQNENSGDTSQLGESES